MKHTVSYIRRSRYKQKNCVDKKRAYGPEFTFSKRYDRTYMYPPMIGQEILVLFEKLVRAFQCEFFCGYILMSAFLEW